jgi:hypothetical protein
LELSSSGSDSYYQGNAETRVALFLCVSGDPGPDSPIVSPDLLSVNCTARTTAQPKEKENTMPQGDKSSYTDKQKRQAEHIEKGYEKRGLATKTAEKRAWSTVNKLTGGGRKSGSGRTRRPHPSSR